MKKSTEILHSDTRRAWAWVPALYFAEGLPYVAVMTVCTIMYKRFGVSNTEIAFYTAWLYLPWVIKPFWSPVVDIIGTKRRWVVAMQAMLAAGFAAVAFALPTPMFFSASLAAFWVVAFLSATHDIAADGFYMLGLSQESQSLFIGIRTVFYRLALIAGQGGLVVLAGLMENKLGVSTAWATAFALVSVLFLLMAVYNFVILPRPSSDHPSHGITLSDLGRRFADTFRTFFSKPGIVVALSFMILYRFPEALLVKLISPFLIDPVSAGGLGLTTTQVGYIYGTVGTIGLMAGGVIGGIVASRGGLRRWLMPMAWSMSLTCLTFVYLAFVPGQSLFSIALCVTIEQFGYGFGGTAYMLYLIFFSRGKWQTSHYAMCTGVMALGMMLPGMAAGWLQEHTGYPVFFIITSLLCALTIAVAMMVKVPENFGRKASDS